MISKLPNGACPAERHPQESLRIQALHDLQVLDTLPEPMFDDIVQLASEICQTPIALISLIDSERQWFKAKVGLDAPQTPRELAFCAHAILNADDVLVVRNALEDERFATNPLVTSEPHIRFYAGAPIVSPQGLPLGTVCAIDREPRTLTPGQARSLQALSRQVARMLTLRRAALDRVQAAEAALSERGDEAARLMAFAAMDLDLKCFVDRHYVYRAVNAAYLRYWCRDEVDVVGKTVADVRGASVFDGQLRAHIDRAMLGEQVSFETRSLYPAKGLRRMQVTFVPARSEAGDVVGVVIDEHDIQDLTEAAQKLRDTVAALEQKTLSQKKFIYMLSRDLRDPVDLVLSGTGGVLHKLQQSSDPEVRHFSSAVQDCGLRLKTVLDDLLEHVRRES